MRSGEGTSGTSRNTHNTLTAASCVNKARRSSHKGAQRLSLFSGSLLPFLVYAVCALVEGQRFDVVLADLACLGFQSGGNVGLEVPVLPLDGPHLERSLRIKRVILPDGVQNTTGVFLFRGGN